MNFRNIDGTHLVAAIAALCALTAHAAPSGGSGTDLRGVTQNWDKVLPTEPGSGCPNWSTRFTCVMNNAAVRDNETGLVWTHPRPHVMSWHLAKQECLNLAVGNRKGWRLPSVTELASLIDMSNPSELKLPAHMPFIYQQKPGAPAYWTSTSIKLYQNTTPSVYLVSFDGGWVYDAPQDFYENHVWCVRGGQPEASVN